MRIDNQERDLEVNPRSGKRIDDAPRPMRHGREVCAVCRRRPAVTVIRGRHVALGDHDMCRQCWQAQMDARHATRLARRTAPGRPR